MISEIRVKIMTEFYAFLYYNLIFYLIKSGINAKQREKWIFFGKLSFLHAKLNRKKIIKQKMHGAESFVALPTPIRKETRKIKWN